MFEPVPTMWPHYKKRSDQQPEEEAPRADREDNPRQARIDEWYAVEQALGTMLSRASNEAVSVDDFVIARRKEGRLSVTMQTEDGNGSVDTTYVYPTGPDEYADKGLEVERKKADDRMPGYWETNSSFLKDLADRMVLSSAKSVSRPVSEAA